MAEPAPPQQATRSRRTNAGDGQSAGAPQLPATAPPALRIQPGGAQTAPAGAPAPLTDALRSPGPGQPLPAQVAGPVGSSLGVDPSPIRLHTDAKAADATASVGARAFAWGTDIYLGAGQQPTDLGLVAHEAAHVVQQQAGPALQLFPASAAGATDALEHEARAASAATVRGEPAPVTGRTGGPQVQRDWLPGWARRGVEAVASGARAVASAAGDLAAAARDRALQFVKDRARAIPGYELLGFVLGKDPITQQPVARTAVNLIRALVGLLPGGAILLDQLQRTGVLERAGGWLTTELARLDLTWPVIRGLFEQAWNALSITDLASPGNAFEKLKGIFGPPLGRLKAFALAAGKKLIEFIFEGAMALGGAGAQRVLALFRRVGAVFDLVAADPVKFLGNLVSAVKGGFEKFAARIGEHLKTALFDWLLGALAGALTLPRKWDLRGIIDVVLQVLGLTYSALRLRLVRLVGERAVGVIERAFGFLKTIVTDGLAAAWRELLEFATGLVDTVVEGIRNWVVTSIVKSAVVKIASLFNPIGALIQAAIGIYNTVMFFIERAQQLAALLESVVDSIERIARGNIASAVEFVERSMVRALSAIISFLARFIGLGNVAGTIKSIIARIQAVVGRALDRVTEFIGRAVRGLLAGLRGDKNAPPAAGALPEKAFTASGDAHTLSFKRVGSREQLMIASDPTPIEAFLDESEKSPDVPVSQKQQIPKARALAAQATKLADEADRATADKAPDIRKRLGDAETSLAGILIELLKYTPLARALEKYKHEGLYSTYGATPREVGDRLTADHQPQAAVLKVAAGLALFAGRKLQGVIKGRHVDLGRTVNLHEIRHRLGRTYGGKGGATKDAFVNEAQKVVAGPGRDDAKRTAIVALLRRELLSDVEAIRAVIRRGPDDPAWSDAREAGVKRADRRALIARVNAQVTQGEDQIRSQDLESLKDPG